MEDRVTKKPKKRIDDSKRPRNPTIQGDRIIAIDPGSRGGLCYIEAGTRTILATMPMPLDRCGRGIDPRCVKEWVAKFDGDIVLEQVPYTIGAVGNSASEFKLGMVYGQVIGALFDKEINYITPRKWQGVLGLSADKKATIKWVASNFTGYEKCLGPRGGVLDGITDAVAIGYAWWKLQQGEKHDESRVKLFFARRKTESDSENLGID